MTHWKGEAPRKGWVVQSEVDLKSLCGVCDFCGTPLRYEVGITHPEGLAAIVGRNCAEKLSENYISDATRGWLKSFRLSKKDNLWSKRHDCLLYQKDGGWAFRLKDYWHNEVFESDTLALKAAREMFLSKTNSTDKSNT